MFNTASGVFIPFPERIREEYSISDNQIVFNISFERLKPIVNEFISSLLEPIYLIIKKPLKEKYKPNSFTKGPFKAELLYIDVQTKEKLNEVFNQFGEILFNDGMSQFGIRSHVTGDEIFIAKYKTIYIFSNEVNKHIGLLDKNDIAKTDDLILPRDLMSSEYPGKRSRVVINNKDIFDVAEYMKDMFVYKSMIVDD